MANNFFDIAKIKDIENMQKNRVIKFEFYMYICI